MPGLRKILNEILEEEGYLTLDSVHNIAREHGKKQSTAERTMRQSISPCAIPVLNEKGFIMGYRHSKSVAFAETQEEKNKIIEEQGLLI